MTSLNIQLDDNLKSRLESFARKQGKSLLESVYTILNLGVDIAENEDDLDSAYTEEEETLLYSAENVEAILRSKKQIDEGKKVLITVDELRNYQMQRSL